MAGLPGPPDLAPYALEALQLEVDAKSTPASVDAKLASYSNTAAMNSAITANNVTADVDQRVTTALLTYVTQVALDAALALRDGRLDGGGLPNGGATRQRHRDGIAALH